MNSKKNDPSLLEKYESLLWRELPERHNDNQISRAEPEQRQELLQRVTRIGLEHLSKKATYHIAGHEFRITDQIAQAAELLEWAKDWIGSAVEASPQASLAWSGICLVMPLLTKPAAAEQANQAGFAYVNDCMKGYVALEDLMLPQNTDSAAGTTPKKPRERLQVHIIELYRLILHYQIKTILRFYDSARKNFRKDLFKSEKKGWKQMLEEIKNLEKQIRDDSQQISGLFMERYLKVVAEASDKSRKSMKQLLTTAEQQLQVSKKQLTVAKNQLLSTTTQQENACHRVFRIIRGEGTDGEDYEAYKNKVKDRVEETCKWFLGHPNFGTWLHRSSGLLLVTADPGCGKSVLAKYMIDHEIPRAGGIVCYFFFDAQYQNTIEEALCALLHQLFIHKAFLISRHALNHYNSNGPKLVKVTSLLWTILKRSAYDPDTGPVTFVLDALDECNKFQHLCFELQEQLFSGNKDSKDNSKVKFSH